MPYVTIIRFGNIKMFTLLGDLFEYIPTLSRTSVVVIHYGFHNFKDTCNSPLA